MRWPVTSGVCAGSLRATGRGRRTDQTWLIASSRRRPSPWRSTQTTASSACSPGAATDSTTPPASGGARQSWGRPAPPLAVPITAPGSSTVPASIRGSKRQRRAAPLRIPGCT